MQTQALQLQAFVPSGADFTASLEFFKALGFRENWHAEGVAELQSGNAIFLLQDFQNSELQNNLTNGEAWGAISPAPYRLMSASGYMDSPHWSIPLDGDETSIY